MAGPGTHRLPPRRDMSRSAAAARIRAKSGCPGLCTKAFAPNGLPGAGSLTPAVGEQPHRQPARMRFAKGGLPTPSEAAGLGWSRHCRTGGLDRGGGPVGLAQCAGARLLRRLCVALSARALRCPRGAMLSTPMRSRPVEVATFPTFKGSAIMAVRAFGLAEQEFRSFWLCVSTDGHGGEMGTGELQLDHRRP